MLLLKEVEEISGRTNSEESLLRLERHQPEPMPLSLLAVRPLQRGVFR